MTYATDIDVLAADRRVSRGSGYWRIESPSNHAFWWGNFLLFDQPPGPGDGQRWPEIFAREFGQLPQVAHQSFAWDRTDGSLGAARSEFPDPYEISQAVGLIAVPAALRLHVRANDEVRIRALGPAAGQDEDLWRQVLDLQVAQLRASPIADGLSDVHLGGFRAARNRELRRLFEDGRGGSFVAMLEGAVVASLGIVVTGGRARYQSVDTAEAHRGRGIATRLVYEAARLVAAQQPVDHYVIVADPEYHALHIYESLGFRPVERVSGVQLRPGAV